MKDREMDHGWTVLLSASVASFGQVNFSCGRENDQKKEEQFHSDETRVSDSCELVEMVPKEHVSSLLLRLSA
jgi:hypothetical protein